MLHRTVLRAVARSPVLVARQRYQSTRAGVVMSGCGVFDGSEIFEATAMLYQLSRRGASVTIYAPDADQMHVIDHTTGDTQNQTRNVLKETARIARKEVGELKPLSTFNAKDVDVLLFPGGFGAAKNLCNFATAGTDMKVNEEVEKAVKAMHQARKPLGFVCISPVIAAKVIPGVELTMGKTGDEKRWPHQGAIGAAKKLGANMIEKELNEIVIDKKNKVVSNAAFMCNAPVHEVMHGVEAVVDAVLQMK